MKSFFCSLGIFILMLGLIVWNYVYMASTCDALAEKIEALPACDGADDALAALSEYWDREKNKIGISVSQHTIDKMNDCMAELKYAVKNRDAQIFECARYRAISIVEELRDAESLSLENWI